MASTILHIFFLCIFFKFIFFYFFFLLIWKIERKSNQCPQLRMFSCFCIESRFRGKMSHGKLSLEGLDNFAPKMSRSNMWPPCCQQARSRTLTAVTWPEATRTRTRRGFLQLPRDVLMIFNRLLRKFWRKILFWLVRDSWLGHWFFLNFFNINLSRNSQNTYYSFFKWTLE